MVPNENSLINSNLLPFEEQRQRGHKGHSHEDGLQKQEAHQLVRQANAAPPKFDPKQSEAAFSTVVADDVIDIRRGCRHGYPCKIWWLYK